MNQVKAVLMVFFLLLMNSVIISQNKSAASPISDEAIKSKSYPIDGTPLLQKEYEQTANYLSAHPEFQSGSKLKKTQWAFTVGSTKTWWSIDFTTNLYYLASATCRAVNAHSYVFVEDENWGVTVNQAAVDSISNAFDVSTPADPAKGIYQTDVDAFGKVPDVDSDPRIIILILNIRDGSTGGAYIAGYFNPLNETNLSFSNQAEIYYVDCNPASLTTTQGLTMAMGTTAHEFQHMINWNYHKTNQELTFINESLSQLATNLCGYPLDYNSYLNDVNKFLFSWNSTSDVLNDYSRAARFFVYLKDQFGVGLFKNIVQNNIAGVAGLQSALTGYGIKKTLDQIFVDWCIANAINDRTVDPAFGYNEPISTVPGTDVPSPVANDTIPGLQNYAVTYLNFNYGSNLRITFNKLNNANVVIKAVEKNDSTVRVLDVPLGQQFSEPLFGSLYKSIQFIIINDDMDNYTLCTYQSIADITGEAELKWDVGEPKGYYIFSTNDTMCVVFNSFPGGVLDSIRIALRRPGTITGGIWQSTGLISPSPLGAPLVVPITASITTETPVPYPVPYENWTSIDLRSYKMSTDKPFAVGFVLGKTPSAPGIMMSYYPGASPRNSYTYLRTTDKVTTPGWYYITNPAGDSISVYLIRAYAHNNTTGVSSEVELTPENFTLDQNYPNPFNPSTTIWYSVPTESRVTLKIFNLLGQEIATVVDENKAAGKYSTTFNAGNLSSGVYYYRIEAGSFKSMKKMLLMK